MLNSSTLFFLTLLVVIFIIILIILTILFLIYIVSTFALRKIVFNIFSIILALIFASLSIFSLIYSEASYLALTKNLIIKPALFEIKETFLLNGGDNLLLITSYEKNIEIGYFDTKNNKLISKSSFPLSYQDPKISGYTNDNKIFYIHAENHIWDKSNNLQIKNHTLLKLDLETFIQDNSINILIDNIDDFWFKKPDANTDYAYYMYRNQNEERFNLTTIQSEENLNTQIELPGKNGIFKYKGALMYTLNSTDYLFCAKTQEFIPDALTCPSSEEHTTFIYDTDNKIKKWNNQANLFDPIHTDFFVGKMNTTIYHSNEELIFITREDYKHPAFLVYISEDTSWQINLGKDTQFNGSSITYENQKLCHQNSEYDDKTYSYSASCLDIQSQEEVFYLDSDKLEGFISIYAKKS